MKQIPQQEIINYVESNIATFHRTRLDKLKKLKLKDILKRKNPYLFKAKNITTDKELIKSILDAFLSSSEEGLFGRFLEELAIFLCSSVFDGKKSSAEGIDLEFEREGIKYLVSIKSGPNWGNSSQIQKMKDNFKKAKRILGSNLSSSLKVVAVNGCCYGKDSQPDKGDYLKLCGQRFWEFISGNEFLYTEIIEALSYKAEDKNEEFAKEYNKVIDKFTLEFMEMFCNSEGQIIWDKLVQFNSSKD
jgi:hypothetical protein